MEEMYMRLRTLVAFGVLVVVAMVMSLSVSGQTQQPAAKKPAPQVQPKPTKAAAAESMDRAKQAVPKDWVMPKTSWGEPDLQGVWSYATTTPLSRPANQQKTTLTDEEIEQLRRTQEARADGPVREGDTGTYNGFWFDRGQAINRTSLIIDPP